jgi:hypothetical protein
MAEKDNLLRESNMVGSTVWMRQLGLSFMHWGEFEAPSTPTLGKRGHKRKA